MFYYFKTKFPVCCHLSVSTEGYQLHIRYKSRQNKSHNEITIQLCAKVAKFSGIKVKYTGSILTWVQMMAND